VNAWTRINASVPRINASVQRVSIVGVFCVLSRVSVLRVFRCCVCAVVLRRYIILHADTADYEDEAFDFARLGGTPSGYTPSGYTPSGYTPSGFLLGAGDLGGYVVLADGGGVGASGVGGGGSSSGGGAFFEGDHGGGVGDELSLAARVRSDVAEGWAEFSALRPLGKVL